MGSYYNHYYGKFTEDIKLKCGYDFDYIIKYVWCKKNWQLQWQVSNICHVNNIFRTSCCTITLKIETGRYGVNRVPAEERLCDACNSIEDEFHVLMKCPIY